MAGDKNPAADRSHGGPGSSHEDAAGAHPHGKEKHVGKGAPHERNASDAGTVGGGGDKDGHNSHDPREKGKHGAR